MSYRTLVIGIASIGLAACGSAPRSGSSAGTVATTLVAGTHTYVISAVGSGGQVAAALLGSSTPSSTYQVYLPSGGGIETIGASASTLTLTDTSANPQLTHYGATSVTVSVTRDGDAVAGSPRTFTFNGESFDWGTL